MMLVILLVMAAGVTVLLLLYRLLQLRHRLRMARARHALEYYGFYHSATYRLQHVPLYEAEAEAGCKPCPGPGPAPGPGPGPAPGPGPGPAPGPGPGPAPGPGPGPAPGPGPGPALMPLTSLSPPTIVVTSLPPVPPSFAEATPLIIPPLADPCVPALLRPPVSQATPSSSPHLSWGACSDADLYSRVGVFRSSRLSSLSNQSRVILFEHSSL
ncbi:uncharacterized protein [Eucyclogobius newberryi]|uniref:uncharacterized protein n=1 Tax=Eucyclogobius newberryi TaxID=166745 RepID=UPI003B5C8567